VKNKIDRRLVLDFFSALVKTRKPLLGSYERLLRLFMFIFYSVGLENVEDLKKDLKQALEKACA